MKEEYKRAIELFYLGVVLAAVVSFVLPWDEKLKGGMLALGVIVGSTLIALFVGWLVEMFYIFRK